MMFILQKKNKKILYIIFNLLFCLSFLVSCRTFIPTEPVAEVNERFNANYGSLVRTARKKNKASIKNSGSGRASFEKTAYGRMLKNEADFIETNARNNPYITVQRAGSDNMEYLSFNSGAFAKTENNMFDEIKIPKNDFKYYNLGKKEYNEISNIELQESYDYGVEINKERLKQIEIVRLRQEAIMLEQEKNQSLADKTRKGLKSLTEKIKDLIGFGEKE